MVEGEPAVDQPGAAVRVNLGAGDMPADGWVDVDHEGCPYPRDETVDLTGPLPWADGSVDLVYAGHVLEHLSVEDCHRLLVDLRRCMRPGGQLMVVGPDLDRAEAMAAVGTLDVTLQSLRFGASRWPGDEHRWECTSTLVMQMLTEAGWIDIVDVPIQDVPPPWPVAYRPLWQCAVSARP